MNDSPRSHSHHRATTRLPARDYARPGYYFVTICTKHRIPWFGEIYDGQMRSSDIGKIIAQCWHAIPMHFPHITLDAYVVMPDHVHGILIMGKRNMQSRTTMDCGGNSIPCVGACESHAPDHAMIEHMRPISIHGITPNTNMPISDGAKIDIPRMQIPGHEIVNIPCVGACDSHAPTHVRRLFTS